MHCRVTLRLIMSDIWCYHPVSLSSFHCFPALRSYMYMYMHRCMDATARKDDSIY